MRGFFGHLWHQRHCRSAAANDHYFFLFVVEFLGPKLRMNPFALEIGLTWKMGLVAILVAVIAATQIKKSGFQDDGLIIVFLVDCQGPACFMA